MEERRPRERELVLAPNEYAYVLDTTKGHINCYVGPNKTSLAQTDAPVVFNALTKRFDAASDLRDAVQLFSTAPAGWYLVLKNPANDTSHPRPGVASGSIELKVGKKVIVPGPTSFALWPGQMVKVVEGHRLQSNQYLVARVYDAEEANKHPAAVLGKSSFVGTFEPGQKIIIQGTDVSFYMPPNGVEVVPEGDDRYVRDAVTLQRLEYCVLAAENGKKRTVRGEAVVFPHPDERFVEEPGADGVQRRKFRAIELSEVTGLHIKVIAPWTDDDGVLHKEGEELFWTGGGQGASSSPIYFPREEHAIIKASNGADLHHAVVIPAGEGRYVLDRLSGDIRLVHGPRMFLADPRREVIVRRVLSDRECALYFPGNDAVLGYNRALRSGVEPARGTPASTPAAPKAAAASSTTNDGVEQFARRFVPPRALTLDTRFDGAISLHVWSGFAVQVVNKSGQRRVVAGPQTVLLGWDESLEALSLSTGTPKSTHKLLSTVFLQTTGNQVSDIVDVISHDLVRAAVRVKYRVAFEGDGSRWFLVDNYVKLLCDHAGSIIKAVARKTPIRQLKTHIVDIVRDAVLGARSDDGRAGLRFADNDMRVTDIEVMDLDVVDEGIDALLSDAQVCTVRSAIDVAAKEAALADRARIEEIERKLLEEQQKTKLLARSLELEIEQRAQELERIRLDHRASLLVAKAEHDLRVADHDAALRDKKLAIQQRETRAELDDKEARQALDVALWQAQVEGRVKQAQAYSPDLVASLQRLGDAQLLSSLASNFGELAAVEGKGLLETARKFLDFVPQGTMPVLRTTTKGADAE